MTSRGYCRMFLWKRLSFSSARFNPMTGRKISTQRRQWVIKWVPKGLAREARKCAEAKGLSLKPVDAIYMGFVLFYLNYIVDCHIGFRHYNQSKYTTCQYYLQMHICICMNTIIVMSFAGYYLYIWYRVVPNDVIRRFYYACPQLKLATHQGPLSLTCINFNPNMNK